eukprot:scaffold96_cov172-Amphora_coffeaeformis.AAC.3
MGSFHDSVVAADDSNNNPTATARRRVFVHCEQQQQVNHRRLLLRQSPSSSSSSSSSSSLSSLPANLCQDEGKDSYYAFSSFRRVSRGGCGGGDTRRRSSSANTSTATATGHSSSPDTVVRRKITVALVFAALFNDTLQVSLLVPILPALIRNAGITENAEIAMGIFFAAKDVFQLLGAPIAGHVTQIVGGQVALTASTMGLGLATLVFAQATSYTSLLVARSLQGAASAAVLCGGLSLVAETHPSHVRGSAMGVACTGLAMGVLCGPLLGGILFSRLGQTATFRWAAAVVLGNAALQMVLARLLAPVVSSHGEEEEEQRQSQQNKKSSVVDSGKENKEKGSYGKLLRNRQVMVVAASIALIYGFLGFIKPVSQIILEDEFDMDMMGRSLVITIATATNFVGTPVAGWLSDRVPARSHLVATSLLLMATSSVFFCMRGFGVVWGLSAFCVSVGLIGLALAFNRAVGSALLADLVDRHGLGSYGLAFALADMADSLGLILGPTLGLAISQVFGKNAGALVLGGLCLVLVPTLAAIP